MSQNEALMPETLLEDDWEEIWTAVLSTGGRYELSKNQARLVQEALARGERGVIMFKTFAISLPYVAEFYREKRFLKSSRALPERTSEVPYEPIPEERWQEMKKMIYQKIGKPI